MNNKKQVKFYIVQNSENNNILSRKFSNDVHQHFDDNPNEYFIVEEWIDRNVRKVLSLNGIQDCPFFTTVKEALSFLRKTFETHPHFHGTELNSVMLVEKLNETLIFSKDS